MALHIDNTRQFLQEFNFKTLFLEELGWSRPSSPKPVPFQVKDKLFTRTPIAELSAAMVFEITSQDESIPSSDFRDLISKEIQKLYHEHILIFVDKDRSQCIWRWLKKQDKKRLAREHIFTKGQTGDSFIAKIAALLVDLGEIENNITIVDVALKMQKALDVEKVTKKFYKDYQTYYIDFLNLIEGIPSEADRKWYASVLLNRLMFIYFLQKKFFLDGGKDQYLQDKLLASKTKGKDQYYSHFLQHLFFGGFAKPEVERSEETKALIGNIRYLNGGLFLKHKIELNTDYKIRIPDLAFENLFTLFGSYSWSLNDIPGGNDSEINPDVLGYIFEKYINQKAFGAYYTRTEITEYLCEQTVYKLILDEINGPLVEPELLKKAGLEKSKTKRFDTISDLLINLDASLCKRLVVGPNAILTNLSLLDPACGSGAFLVAAMKTLINVYSAVFGKIDFISDKDLTAWKKKINDEHPSIQYYIKKQIITNNLYGVDLMEEATEIAKLRLFLALVASANKVDELEPLPNIDFNIMQGNSLIGLMRIDESAYNRYQKGDMYKKSYRQLIQEREAALEAYKSFDSSTSIIAEKRKSIEAMEQEANETLNIILGHEFMGLGIKYEEARWDKAKAKLAKPYKRSLTRKDIEALEPFHWGYEFSGIFTRKNGFDAIITNPPWDIFKPNGKEFLSDYSAAITVNKMNIKDFEKEKEELFKRPEILHDWLIYQSRFSHVSQYYRSSLQFKNQISIVNGKKAGSDTNLYKLFTEQCFNLLKPKGYCGIVIPSGIYTDLGTKQLRKMLFEETRVTGLFCFENKKEIFEGVHRSFKFVVLSFEKTGSTQSFPTAFMRHDVEELVGFPKYGASEISVEFIKRQSPDSLSIMEIKNPLDFSIAEKISSFPNFGIDVPGSPTITLSNEFHMTGDSHLYGAKSQTNQLPLVEGKMFWQFQYPYLESKYWLNEKSARGILLGKEEDNGQKLDYEFYRLGFRDVAASTNERCMIMTILPPKVFCPHTVSLERIFNPKTGIYSPTINSERMIIVSICNSYVFDYQIRQSVTNHLSFFLVNNVPFPRITKNNEWYHSMEERAAKLICTSELFAELWQDVMKTPWTENSGATNEEESNRLRAELDGIIAHIYGLNEEEFSYILSTFPIVPQAQKVAALKAYQDVLTGVLKP